MEWFQAQSPIVQALLATTGTWLLTLVGTLPVLLFAHANARVMDGMTGAAAGIMTAASCWSLLVPAMERGAVWQAVLGLLLGGAFIYTLDRLMPKIHPELAEIASREGGTSRWRRPVLLLLAMTIHNFPEGLAVGVSFGGGDLRSAVALAVGIGIQNVPEGLAIAMPLRREGMTRGWSFFWGQLSAIVEPPAGVLGAGLVLAMSWFLPYGMAGAAGAMLYVVVHEMIPEAARGGHIRLVTLSFLGGFALMMALDNALG